MRPLIVTYAWLLTRLPEAFARCNAAVLGRPGQLIIVEAEAEIVREIFTRYVAGQSPRKIAADLNRRRIAPPRGARWSASSASTARSS